MAHTSIRAVRRMLSRTNERRGQRGCGALGACGSFGGAARCRRTWFPVKQGSVNLRSAPLRAPLRRQLGSVAAARENALSAELAYRAGDRLAVDLERTDPTCRWRI
jgi:hypothetical protein